METKVCLFVVFSCFLGVKSHGVATSHQSVVSGEGWRYGYGIAHGPHGIGHADGESFPHGYGGFGAYAPAYGYAPKPEVYLPPQPKPVIIQVPQYIVPHQYNHNKPYGYLYPHRYPIHAFDGLEHGYYGYNGHGHGYDSHYHLKQPYGYPYFGHHD